MSGLVGVVDTDGCGARVRSRPDGAGAVRVVVTGELDIASAVMVRAAVDASAPYRVCLDLTDVTFCSCSALRGILDGVAMTVLPSPAVRRALALLSGEPCLRQVRCA